jgi:arylsulfatase A-like enzyme
MSRRLRRVARLAGIAALALPWLACGAAPEREPAARPASSLPDVLLVSLDTTRADRLGVYGHPHATSPVLDRLAAESLVFERAVSTSSWTLPAHASLFTGKLPTAHGARFDPEGELLLGEALPGDEVPPFRASTIAPAEQTLAERLAEAGYATLGVAGGPWLKRVFGLTAGFAAWDESGVTSWQGAPGPHVTDAALTLLAEAGERPFFLFVNYFDPHSPYRPPLLDRLRVLGNPFAELRGGLARALQHNAYDGEIRRMDRELGRLLDALRVRGRYRDSLIVVTADHGELFGEGGRFGHGNHLSEAELHVPLLVKLPGGARAGERVTARVSTAGVFALILEQAGLPGDDGALPAVTEALPAPVVAETYPLAQASAAGHWRALYVGNLKYLWNSAGRHELRDLSEGWDPDSNRIDDSPELARRLDRQLTEILTAAQSPARERPPVRPVDSETREALESLGYLR